MVERARRENAREVAAAAQRLVAARQEAARLAAELASLKGLRRVLLFGSAARGRGFRTDSDIDIAIEGGDILAAEGIVESSTFHIDIVDLQSANEAMRERIQHEGVLLHEA